MTFEQFEQQRLRKLKAQTLQENTLSHAEHQELHSGRVCAATALYYLAECRGYVMQPSEFIEMVETALGRPINGCNHSLLRKTVNAVGRSLREQTTKLMTECSLADAPDFY